MIGKDDRRRSWEKIKKFGDRRGKTFLLSKGRNWRGCWIFLFLSQGNKQRHHNFSGEIDTRGSRFVMKLTYLWKTFREKDVKMNVTKLGKEVWKETKQVGNFES
jgi:hypothetical protein